MWLRLAGVISARANDLPLEDDGLPAMDSIIKALYFDRVAAPMRALFGPRFKYIISGGAALNGMVAKSSALSVLTSARLTV